MQDEQLHGKFFVDRVDGQDRPDARYFVLNYATDPYARRAMREYATACEETHPALAADLVAVADWHDARDARRRRNNPRPVRGTHGSGGEAPGDDAALEMLRRRAGTDPDFAGRAAAALEELHPTGTG